METPQKTTQLKTKIRSVTRGTYGSVTEDNSIVEEIVMEIVKVMAEKGLNYRQTLVVLELVQAEIKECTLVY